MKAAPFLLTGFLCSTATLFAHAEESGQEGTERAAGRALMREGNVFYAAGDTQKAYERFLAAWQRAKGFDIACNLGRTALELGRVRDAAEYLDYCLRHYSLSSKDEVVQAEHEVREALDAAKERVATLTIDAAPGGSEVFVDGMEVGRQPLEAPVYLEPGTHRILATLAGHRPASAAVVATAGTETTLRLELSSDVPAAVTPRAAERDTPPRPRPDRASPVPAILTGALSLAGVSVGIGFLVAAGDKDSARSDRLAKLPGESPCGQGTPYSSDCAAIRGLADDAATFRAVSYTSFGVAVAAAAATYFLWPREGSPRTGLRLVPLVARDGAGLDVTEAF
jgi:hypothetical protein